MTPKTFNLISGRVLVLLGNIWVGSPLSTFLSSLWFQFPLERPILGLLWFTDFYILPLNKHQRPRDFMVGLITLNPTSWYWLSYLCNWNLDRKWSRARRIYFNEVSWWRRHGGWGSEHLADHITVADGSRELKPGSHRQANAFIYTPFLGLLRQLSYCVLYFSSFCFLLFIFIIHFLIFRTFFPLKIPCAYIIFLNLKWTFLLFK